MEVDQEIGIAQQLLHELVRELLRAVAVVAAGHDAVDVDAVGELALLAHVAGHVDDGHQDQGAGQVVAVQLAHEAVDEGDAVQLVAVDGGGNQHSGARGRAARHDHGQAVREGEVVAAQGQLDAGEAAQRHAHQVQLGHHGHGGLQHRHPPLAPAGGHLAQELLRGARGSGSWPTDTVPVHRPRRRPHLHLAVQLVQRVRVMQRPLPQRLEEGGDAGLHVLSALMQAVQGGSRGRGARFVRLRGGFPGR